jgi:uncharacterized membrane protein YcaP (DUF421 family)
VASVAALLLTVYIVNRVPFLQKNMQSKALTIMENGRFDHDAMKKHQIGDEELQETARKYGVRIEAFESLTLEGDGSITGIIKREFFAGKETD